MSWTVVEVDGNGVRETRRGGELAGDQPAEPKLKPKPKMVTWRLCSRTEWGRWFPAGKIPEGFIPMESQTLPRETVKQLPEGFRP